MKNVKTIYSIAAIFAFPITTMAESTYEQCLKNNNHSAEVTISNVPFQSQRDASCNPNNLCQYAAANMLTTHLFNVKPKIEYVQKMAKAAKGSSCPKSFSSFLDVDKAINAVVPKADFKYQYESWDTMKCLVSKNKPVSIALKYGKFKRRDRCQKNFKGGHQVVVVGYSESKGLWRIHDPLCKQNGGYREIKSSKLRSAVYAMSEGDKNFNKNYLWFGFVDKK